MIKRERSCVRLQKFFKGNGRTKQSFRQECDINAIVAKANVTGVLSHVNNCAPVYADVSNIPDYQSALEIVNNSERLFMALPSVAREKFENDPVKLFEFLRDKGNYEEAVKLGLVVKKDVVPPVVPADPATPAK